MDWLDLRYVRSRLPRSRTVFHYFKDRYALMLLKWLSPCDLEALRRSHWAALLRKEVVARALGDPSARFLDRHGFGFWPSRHESYRLTFDLWGSSRRWQQEWHQTSRPGLNLVLQLNFGSAHDRALERLIPCEPPRPYGIPYGHPMSATQRTLAWSRIDLSVDAEEALIEEIQSDWVREARSDLAALRKVRSPHRRDRMARNLFGADVPYRNVERYAEEVLRPHARIWEETMLAATLWLVRDVLRIRRIYLHTWASGRALKQVEGAPVSLYEQLPRRFCFAPADAAPCFLRNSPHRRVRRAVSGYPGPWHLLHL